MLSRTHTWSMRGGRNPALPSGGGEIEGIPGWAVEPHTLIGGGEVREIFGHTEDDGGSSTHPWDVQSGQVTKWIPA
jgi:hypothetical protein